jgi:hypothetical protein
MARRITVEDLDRMTPQERQQAFEASIVWDLDNLPADRLADLRARAARFAADRDVAGRQIASGE